MKRESRIIIVITALALLASCSVITNLTQHSTNNGCFEDIDVEWESLDVIDYSDARFAKDKASIKAILIKDLGELPDLSEFTNLCWLRIYWCNGLNSSSFSNLRTCKGVEVLTIDYCDELKTIPEEIAQMTSLKRLAVTSCHNLKDCSALTELDQLELLNLSYNRLYECPASIKSLVNLRFLYLQKNRIKTFESIRGLEMIEELGIGSDSLIAVPGFISDIPNLQSLNLICSRNIEPFESLAHASHVRRLDLSFCNIKILPKLLTEFTQLEHIELADNDSLRDVSLLKDISTLRSLGLSSVYKDSLHSSISSLGNLSRIDLSYSDVPHSAIEELRKELPNTEIYIFYD